MSFTAYASAIAGSILTASFWNAQVKNNGLVLKTTIDDNGKIAYATVSKSADYTLTATDDTVRFDATAAPKTGTLPTAVGRAGKTYDIKKLDASTNAVTVATTSAQTIDGASTYVLSVQYQAVTVRSNGANWEVY